MVVCILPVKIVNLNFAGFAIKNGKFIIIFLNVVLMDKKYYYLTKQMNYSNKKNNLKNMLKIIKIQLNTMKDIKLIY